MDGGTTTSDDRSNDLRKWISAAVLNIDGIKKYDLKVYRPDDKTENYGSDIAFVDIFAENFDKERREYNLIIKYGSKDEAKRKNIPIREAFEREIDIYNKIIPCYHKFQQERNLPVFASIPKQFLTILRDTEEVIILENLKQVGYKLHNRHIPMDLDHIKLVLEAYAEWHALALTLKDQNCKNFLNVTKTWNENALLNFLSKENGRKMINDSQQYLYDVLKETDQMELLHRYKEKIGNRKASDVMLELLKSEESQSVVLHADCWNNNFLFKYEDDELLRPRCTRVAMLDFQISFVHSPAFDLSHFIYAVASTEELKHFPELLHHYYNQLSNKLRIFGSDPEKLFPFSDLILHLQKYSAYGAMFNTMIVLFALTNKDNVPDFGRDDGMDVLKKVVQNEEYRNRVFGVARHFVEHQY